jgi:DNA-binding protein H-NS
MARTLSLEDIQRKIGQLQAEAERLAHAEKPGIKQLRAVLKKFKLGLPDVRIALEGTGKRRRSKLKGVKLKPKYRNPKNKIESWTGRGRMPLWMAAMVKQGKKPDDFLIKAL